MPWGSGGVFATTAGIETRVLGAGGSSLPDVAWGGCASEVWVPLGWQVRLDPACGEVVGKQADDGLLPDLAGDCCVPEEGNSVS